jgi:hypothetical protein
MALVKRGRTYESIEERHGINNAGEGGNTCTNVTTITEAP